MSEAGDMLGFIMDRDDTKDKRAAAEKARYATAVQLLKDMHSMHRAFSGNDNWTPLDDDVRAAVEDFLKDEE